MSIKAVSIEGIKAFQSLDAIQRESLAKVMTRRVYALGDSIINQTTDACDVYFLISGKVRVCTYSNNGKEIQFEDLESGEMFGELAALDGDSRTSECVALSESIVAVMSQTDFLVTIDTHTGVNRYVISRLVQMLRNHMGRVIEFSTHSVKDRLRLELFRMAVSKGALANDSITIDEAPTHADIASRISTHREAVTRELKYLEKSKIITWTRNVHMIHDLEALRAKNS